jgi:hypothetical protein
MKDKIKRSGYWYIHLPAHPFSGKQGYFAEHRLVMERKLGRYLTRKEVVHHLNHIKTDNRAENLCLSASAGQHILKFHKEVLQKASAACVGRDPWNKGKKDVYTKETLEKMSKGRTGQSAWNKGKAWSEEVKMKLSKTGKGRHYSPKSEFRKGQSAWNKGKTWSTETREKMRIAALARHKMA